MKLKLSKSNPSKYKLGSLIAVMTFLHAVTLLLRTTPPQAYEPLLNLFPIFVLESWLILAPFCFFLGNKTSNYHLVQLSLYAMWAYYIPIFLILLSTGLYNGAIMWGAAVVGIYRVIKMPPVELVRGNG